MADRLGELMMRRRKKLGLTLRDMAAKTGLSNPYLCQLETGLTRNPSARAVLAISEAYRIPIVRLVKACGDERDGGGAARIGEGRVAG